jgi:hypothetical protein
MRSRTSSHSSALFSVIDTRAFSGLAESGGFPRRWICDSQWWSNRQITIGRPYSQDLRERVIAAVDCGTGAYAAASVFRVSVSYMYKDLGRRRPGGTTARIASQSVSNASHMKVAAAPLTPRPFASNRRQHSRWRLCMPPDHQGPGSGSARGLPGELSR